MDVVWSLFFACLALGSVVGLLAGLLGIGGGLIVVPALSLLLPWAGVSADIAMPMAIATSLASIVITSFSSAYSHYRLGNIQIKMAKTLLPGLLIGGFVGSALADALPSEYLSRVFGVIVLLLAGQMLLSLRFKNEHPLPSNGKNTLVGGIIGTISSLAGIGGGSLTVPYLNYHGIEMRVSIGTASLCGMFLAISGMTGFIFFGLNNSATLPPYSIGYVYLPALIGIVSTSVVTTRIGAKLASSLPTKTIKHVFAFFLFFVGISMLIKG